MEHLKYLAEIALRRLTREQIASVAEEWECYVSRIESNPAKEHRGASPIDRVLAEAEAQANSLPGCDESEDQEGEGWKAA